MFGLLKTPAENSESPTRTLRGELAEQLQKMERLESLDRDISDRQKQLSALEKQIRDAKTETEQIIAAKEKHRTEHTKAVEKATAEVALIKAQAGVIAANLPDEIKKRDAEIQKRQKLVDAIKAFVFPLQCTQPYLEKNGWVSCGGGRWKDPADLNTAYDATTATKVQGKNDLRSD